MGAERSWQETIVVLLLVTKIFDIPQVCLGNWYQQAAPTTSRLNDIHFPTRCEHWFWCGVDMRQIFCLPMSVLGNFARLCLSEMPCHFRRMIFATVSWQYLSGVSQELRVLSQIAVHFANAIMYDIHVVFKQTLAFWIDYLSRLLLGSPRAPWPDSGELGVDNCLHPDPPP